MYRDLTPAALDWVLNEALDARIAGGARFHGRAVSDERLAAAIRQMHETPSRPWTVARLAKEAALSRSAFFERFRRTVGVAPMEYLLAWRMALAKNLLRRKEGSISEVAERVGYSSASTFTIAFRRHVGLPPARYARQQMAAQMSAVAPS